MTEDRLAGNYSYVVSANYSGRTNFNRHVEAKIAEAEDEISTIIWLMPLGGGVRTSSAKLQEFCYI